MSRFTGNAICALASNKQGASQLLAGGVVSILATLPIIESKGSLPGSTPPAPESLLVGKVGCTSVSSNYQVANSGWLLTRH